MNRSILWIVVCVSVGCAAALASAAAKEFDPTPYVPKDDAAKIDAAVPAKASAAPGAARKVLIFTEGKRGLVRRGAATTYVGHKSAPYCAMAIAAMGRKTGAFAATITDDPKAFDPGGLDGYDAVVLANAYLDRVLFGVGPKEADRYKARQKTLTDFVAGGKGLVGIHVAAAEALGWPEFNEMLGGTHRGHAWHAHETVPIETDDPGHPINAAFGGRSFAIQDDVYEFAAPYSRESVRVLLSVYTPKAPPSMTADRADGDYPVSWVRKHGSGRVFYTAMGHSPATWQNAAVLRHVLDGIQFAAGDLKCETAASGPLRGKRPTGAADRAGWRSLFNGTDYTGWKLAEKDKAHWKVRDGVMRFDGQGPTIWTAEEFGDFTVRVDWRFPREGDSGVFVRGSGRGQVNIWTWAMGSGEMWSFRGGAKTPEAKKLYTPSVNADKPVGEWNTFVITAKGQTLSVALNGREVIHEAPITGLKPAGPIALQRHGNPIEFKAIYVKQAK